MCLVHALNSLRSHLVHRHVSAGSALLQALLLAVQPAVLLPLHLLPWAQARVLIYFATVHCFAQCLREQSAFHLVQERKSGCALCPYVSLLLCVLP